MLLDLVIAACTGFAAAGVLLAAFRLFGRRPARWLMPAVAALAIVAVIAFLRYGWAERTLALLPADMVVIDTVVRQDPFRPWTLLAPVTEQLVAVDTTSRRTNPAHPDLVAIDLVLIRREAETRVARHLVDCADRRTAQLPRGASLTGDTLPDGLTWSGDVPDGLFQAACSQ